MPAEKRKAQSSSSSDESSSSSEEEQAKSPPASQRNKRKSAIVDDDDSDDGGSPALAKRVQAKKKAATTTPKKAVKTSSAAKKSPKKPASSQDSKPSQSQGRKSGAPVVPSEVAATREFLAASQGGDTSLGPDMSRGGVKWTTLEHNGVMFAPPPELHGIPILYDGQKLKLSPEAEEVATMYAIMRNSDYYANVVFMRNFFHDWKEILDATMPGHPVRELKKCNFDDIWAWHSANQERKIEERKKLTAADRARVKAEKEAEEEKYKWCLVNGFKQPVGNFRVEPPGLFRGRGNHPKIGCLKKRVQPEDVMLNIGADAPIPEPPAGHKWGKICHDNTVQWIAGWESNVLGEKKYVSLAACSVWKTASDMRKYDVARGLREHIDAIRTAYKEDLKSSEIIRQQRAVVMYLIDNLALRVGGEKSAEEADTVGCCSLRVEHMSFPPSEGDAKLLTLDFLGKDSVPYHQTVEVDSQVHHRLKQFCKADADGNSKSEQDEVFDTLNPTYLNAHLKTFYEDLSAKVWRTYNSSELMDRLLHDPDRKMPANATLEQKVAFFDGANRQVALLCNHQKSVSALHGSKLAKLEAELARDEDLLKRYKEFKAKANKKGADIAKLQDEWDKAERTVEDAWLDKHGEDADRDAVMEARKKKVGGRAAPRPTPKKTEAKTTKKADTKESKPKKVPAKKAAPKKAKVAKKTIVDDDDSSDSGSSASAEATSPAANGNGKPVSTAK